MKEYSTLEAGTRNTSNYRCYVRRGSTIISPLHDAMDLLEIGGRIAWVGEVRRVKVLGALALMERGELDWKIIVIDTDDPHAPLLNNQADLEKYFPGMINETKKWFQSFPGKSFAYEGRLFDKEFTLDLIRRAHEDWQSLHQNRELATRFGINLIREGSDLQISQSPFIDSPEPLNVHAWMYSFD